MPHTDRSQLIPIGRFSSLTRLSVRMLRHYDEHEVLVPAAVDPVSGYRSYAPGQIEEAVRVRTLRDVGFGVLGIKDLLGLRGCPGYPDALTEQRAVLVAELETARNRLELLEQLLIEAHRGQENLMNTTPLDLTIDRRIFAARTVVGLRGVIPTYSDEGRLWRQLMPLVAQQQVPIVGPCGALDHDEDYREADVDVEVWVPVPAGTAVQQPLTVRELPERQTVRAVLRGPYTQLGQACDELVRWATDRELVATGGLMYVYPTDPGSAAPADLVTEIHLPIAT